MNYNFVPSERFFELLYLEPEFCESIGKIMLIAGSLESHLKRYLRARGVQGVRDNSTLGALVQLLKEKNLLSPNGEMHFMDLAHKRNYLAHNLYGLFHHEIEETILPRSKLVELDVEMFCERARDLARDFEYFRNIVAGAKSGTSVLL